MVPPRSTGVQQSDVDLTDADPKWHAICAHVGVQGIFTELLYDFQTTNDDPDIFSNETSFE